jgi:hypothetical protein
MALMKNFEATPWHVTEAVRQVRLEAVKFAPGSSLGRLAARAVDQCIFRKEVTMILAASKLQVTQSRDVVLPLHEATGQDDGHTVVDLRPVFKKFEGRRKGPQRKPP